MNQVALSFYITTFREASFAIVRTVNGNGKRIFTKGLIGTMISYHFVFCFVTVPRWFVDV